MDSHRHAPDLWVCQRSRERERPFNQDGAIMQLCTPRKPHIQLGSCLLCAHSNCAYFESRGREGPALAHTVWSRQCGETGSQFTGVLVHIRQLLERKGQTNPPGTELEGEPRRKAHTKQSRPDSGLGFQAKVLEAFQVVPSSLDRDGGERANREMCSGSEAGS